MSLMFVAGTDTGIGKTVATGLMGRFLRRQGRSVITAKLVQTGCQGLSEDLWLHRRLMEMDWTGWDREGITCPYVFPFPASPHLAARLAGAFIAPEKLDSALTRLQSEFEWVLLEGAGGVQVPLSGTYTTLDFLRERSLDSLVVTSPRLGSLNHTLLTVEALLERGLRVRGLVYNLAQAAAPEITADTREMLRLRYPHIPLADLPRLESFEKIPEVDFSAVLNRADGGG